MRILGIDPGVAIVGFGLIESERGSVRMLQYGAVTTPAGQPLAARLVQIAQDMETLINRFRPDEMSIEELFFSKNITTGIAVAHGRGVILCTAERLGVPIYEYTPMQVKQAVVGYGLADKKQVMDMTKRLLKLKAVPRPDDAADALAIAICHARSATSLLRRKDPNVKETV
mgnify:CR=1 FL=1